MRACVLLLLLCGCPDKKKAPAPAPAPAAEGSTAPILQPVENKLDNSMKKNDERAAPDPETP